MDQETGNWILKVPSLCFQFASMDINFSENPKRRITVYLHVFPSTWGVEASRDNAEASLQLVNALEIEKKEMFPEIRNLLSLPG